MRKKTFFLWLRIGSATIDLSIIYGISIVFQHLLLLFAFVRLCDAYVCGFCLYFTASYLYLGGRSPAKILTGLKIANVNGGHVTLKNIVLRELVLKGGIGIVIPCYILPFAFPYWSPLITLSLELVIILVSFILLIICKKTWWEHFSKTTITKQSFIPSAGKYYVSLSFTLITIWALTIIIRPVLISKEKFSTTFYPEYPVTNETLKYAAFFKANPKNPTDYVFDLFEKYDIVVLSERYHPEYTQYELIFNIINDERFTKNVGNIFTETGSISFQDTLHTYLRRSFINEEELNRGTAILQRNSSGIWPIWDLTNHFDLLKEVNQLNRKLPDSVKINWYYSDIPVNWEAMTKENYKKGYTALRRDSVIAINILEKYSHIILTQKRKKALIILNTNHGYGLLNQNKATGIGWVDSSTTNYLMKALPGKVANVMLNTVSYMWTPIQHGKWETAFKIAGNPNVGFNFAGSPPGNDLWDGFFLSPKNLTYKDIFTGFIFYKPLNRQVKKVGYPYELENFQDSLLRRASCVNAKQVEYAKTIINQYNKDPRSILQTESAPYALFLNVLNVILFPLFIIISYFISTMFLFRKSEN